MKNPNPAYPHLSSLGLSEAIPTESAKRDERELEIEIVRDQKARYYGSRAQLEDEGIVPEGTEWPSGRESLRWYVGELEFWLRRCRPRDMKGPAKLWMEGDFWFLHISRFGEGCTDWDVRRHQRALKEAIYWASEQGRHHAMDTIERSIEADADQDFQAFMAKLSTLTPPERRPR
ncbi:hypothetical protein [Paraburkholderia domus]|uniref:hypothetical protein n=1 Tax=Paraburkholderia domus TaxID=2793075 RepID=UPI001B083896|nr:hypothetical protein [Paraburkholderia domus]CAE6835357.1 hypothetical protein R75483_06892 [Paraburkholderia domus]